MQERDFIAINSELAAELRRFVFEKHKTTYGAIKAEAEEAIKKHIRCED